MGISTHILDTARGRPASDVQVSLAQWSGEVWKLLHQALTDKDGRIASLLPEGSLIPAEAHAPTLRLRFETAAYFATRGERTLYPYIEVTFDYDNPDVHYHVPLLLSAHGYTTYRGS